MQLFRRHPKPAPAPVCPHPDCARDLHDARVERDVRERLDRLERVINAAGDEWERFRDK